MPRALPPGPAPGETMRDPLTPPLADYLDHAAARRIVVGVLLTMMLAALDPVMVATALPTIAASLGDIDNMSWVVTANLLCATAATPLYGKLSDIHGRRTMMLVAIGIYAAGAAGAGRRGTHAAGADHHRRRRLAARPPTLPGLHLLDLHPLHRRRPAA